MIFKVDPPRTMTKKQWKELYSWLRSTSKIIEAEVELRYTNLLIYGTTHPEIYKS